MAESLIESVRLLQHLDRLLSSDGASVEDVAAECSVDPRRVRRRLDDLRALAGPITCSMVRVEGEGRNRYRHYYASRSTRLFAAPIKAAAARRRGNDPQ